MPRSLCAEIGRPVFDFNTVGSTNEVAKRLAARGALHGAIVLSNNQTAGKGRLGKQWHSQAGGLYFSILLKPTLEIDRMPMVTLLIGASVAKAVETTIGMKPRLKWPNDVLYQGRKLAGILVESSLKQHKASYLIAGIGINVCQKEGDFPEAIRDQVTSLRLVSGRSVSKNVLLRHCLEYLDEDFRMMLDHGFESALETWLEYAQIKNKCVCVQLKNEQKTGFFKHLSENGTVHITIDQREEWFPANQIERMADAACS